MQGDTVTRWLIRVITAITLSSFFVIKVHDIAVFGFPCAVYEALDCSLFQKSSNELQLTDQQYSMYRVVMFFFPREKIWTLP